MIPESVLNDSESRIKNALIEVNAVIESAIRSLDVDSEGSLKTTKINIARAMAMRKLILKELTVGAYSRELDAIAAKFETIPDYVTTAFNDVQIDVSFTDVDDAIIKATANDALAEVAAMNTQWAADISSSVYASTISGGSRSDLIKATRQRLIGEAGVRGQPLAPHAATIVNTRIAEIDSLIMLRKGEEAGIQKWKYMGTTISDTRQWCVDHLNVELTTKEVKAWSKSQWKGKKSGDPFVVRGGWNCRHGWSAVVPD